jgi:hypothetical protein
MLVGVVLFMGVMDDPSVGGISSVLRRPLGRECAGPRRGVTRCSAQEGLG